MSPKLHFFTKSLAYKLRLNAALCENAMSDKTYILVDGENLLFRYQAMLDAGRTPSAGIQHAVGKYVWCKHISMNHTSQVARVTYYTTQHGDADKIIALKKEISEISYAYGSQYDIQGRGSLNPKIFKKTGRSRGTKSVDINMCIDSMRHTASQGLTTVSLVTGDGDFLPLIEELMRQGVNVQVQALSDGCNPNLVHTPDAFVNLDRYFFS